MLEKIKTLHNPYDFANPVSDERLFFGRKTEIADVIYYLNHAKGTNKPIHLAFVGARASGKTSFLNMAEVEAKRRDFCVVRINLNEGDVQNDLDFFRKLFHSVVMAAFNHGAFGGRASPTYFSYLELTATGEITDKEQMPLVFAILLGRALKANKNINAPDDILAEDLSAISTEIRMPILILIDECNVLRANRVILEKLRNIFMNMSGYMLALAATPDFFPIMDEIFSPIIRQFKRIDIGPFRSEDDVADCIRTPLANLGLEQRAVRMLAPSLFIKEMDALSGRRPYEIQLICHTLFRRSQDNATRRFTLDLTTLDSIQKELASGQNVDDRPILQKAQSLRRKLFIALDAVLSSKETLHSKDLWRLEYLFHGNTRWVETAFYEAIDDLIRMEIIEQNPQGLTFKGDEFERIYLKYFARSKRANVGFSQAPLERTVFLTFIRMYQDFDSIKPLTGQLAADYADDISQFIEIVNDCEDIDYNNIVVTRLLIDLLNSLIKSETGRTVRLYEIYYTSDLCSGQFWFVWSAPEHIAGIRKLNKRLEELCARGVDIQFNIERKYWDITVPSVATVVSRIQKIADELLSTQLATTLMDMMRGYYVDEKDKIKAKEMAEAAFILVESRLHPEANDVGYLFLDAGDLPEADLWFQAALKYDDECPRLLHYNIGILKALQNNYEEARKHLDIALKSPDMAASCVHTIEVNGDDIATKELDNPTTLEPLIQQALTALKTLSKSEGLAHTSITE